MARHWNDKINESAYLWVMNNAITAENYSKATLYPEDLSNIHLKTRSPRIYRMIKLAYYLGQLRGIRIADEMKNVYTLQNKGESEK